MFKAAWLSAAVLLSLPAFAENPLGMQPGLYELKTVKIVTDGVDHSAQMSDAMAKMQAQMPACRRTSARRWSDDAAAWRQHNAETHDAGVHDG